MTATPNTAIQTQPLTVKQRRSAERRWLRHASLLSQLAWWSSEDRRGQFPMSSLHAETRRLQKAISRLAVLTPSATWAEDAARLRPDSGGSFPPCDDQGVSLMGRARGEKCFYPHSYLTTSGHSWDVYQIALHTGASPLLYEDGYNGSRVTIYDLHRHDRTRVRRAAERGHESGDRMVTNVF